jgi:hypothetical protein
MSTVSKQVCDVCGRELDGVKFSRSFRIVDDVSGVEADGVDVCGTCDKWSGVADYELTGVRLALLNALRLRICNRPYFVNDGTKSGVTPANVAAHLCNVPLPRSWVVTSAVEDAASNLRIAGEAARLTAARKLVAAADAIERSNNAD